MDSEQKPDHNQSKVYKEFENGTNCKAGTQKLLSKFKYLL